MEPHARYELLEKLASGSFATVYRGRDLELGREVAIKQIHEQYLQDPQQLERYWQEAQLLASFQHPNIVTIYDVVRERGWLILELMQGDLSKVAGRRQMNFESLRPTLAHCLRALKFLHAHGIVHGDIKPSNMMIDRRRRVKIGDFGLARRVSDEEGSLLKGTTKYMAPEVVSDDFGEVGPASDLYSLGFAAFELMCGENFESLFPGLNSFGRDRQMAWMLWHAAPDRRLPEISRILDNVPADLAKTIQKLTAKPQSERYRSADEALADLQIDTKSLQSGEESVDGLSRRPGAGVKGNPKRLVAIAAFAASLLLTLGVLFFSGDGTGPRPTGDEHKPLAGIVRDVLVDDGKLVIEDEAGLPEELEVGKQPRIRLNEEQYILLREVKPQDRVQVRITGSPDEKGAVQISVLRPVTGHGKLKEIDPAASKFVATLAADPHPQDVPMYAPEQAKLLLNGRIVPLSDLKPDDRVEIVHLKDTTGRAARVVTRLEARRNVEAVGFVHQIKETDGALWLVLERHGQETPLQFAPDCRVSIDGRTSGDGGNFGPADLKPGDRVTLTHDTHVTEVTAERRHRHTGVLLKVDPGSREIVLRSSDSREETYTVGDDCRVIVDDRPATFEDLRKFDKVEVTFEGAEKNPAAARTIDARRPKI